MPATQYNCPHCGAGFNYDPSKPMQQFRCLKCGGVINVAEVCPASSSQDNPNSDSEALPTSVQQNDAPQNPIADTPRFIKPKGISRFRALLLVVLIVGGICAAWLTERAVTNAAMSKHLAEADRFIAEGKTAEANDVLQKVLAKCSTFSESRRAPYEPRAKATLEEIQSITDAQKLHDIISNMTEDELKAFSNNQVVPQNLQRKEERFTLLLANKLKELLPDELRTRKEAQALLKEACGLWIATKESKNTNRAHELFLKLDQSGNPLGHMWVAFFTWAGSCGFHQDTVSAEAMAKQVIDQVKMQANGGDMEAMLLMGNASSFGFIVPQDKKEAIRWYCKAAEAGNDFAVVLLLAEESSEVGRGVRQVAEAGNAQAMFFLGLMYYRYDGKSSGDESLDGSQAISGYRKIVERWGESQNDAEAAHWLRKAAEAGKTDAMCILGGMYADGKGVPQDVVEAARWFRKSAEADNPEGMRCLGGMYADGKGVPQDVVEAARWFRKSAEAGDASGMCYLGVMYADGSGVPQDSVEAIRWCRKAVEAGNSVMNIKAMRILSAMYFKGLPGMPPNKVEAVRWLRKAAEAGDAEIMFTLGKMCLLGEEGISLDKKEGVLWLRKAAEAGNEDAKKILQEAGR